jgi:hypothetical protein
MGKWRSLAFVLLGSALFLMLACQTAGTPPQSQGAGEPQATKGTPTQSQASAEQQSAGDTQSQAAGESQGTAPAGSAGRSGAASYLRIAAPAASAHLKDLTGKTADMLGNLYRAVTGQRQRPTRTIEYAALAALIVIAVGAIAAVLARRHRKLSPRNP